jgi:hypothetical protein
MEGNLICFKDKTGNVLCTNIEREDYKTLHGRDYKDETGKLNDALQMVMSGCDDLRKPCPAVMTEIQKIDNVIEISVWYYHDFKNGNEFHNIEKVKSTPDKQKIKDIMAIVKKLKISHFTDTAPESLICFEVPNGKLVCTYFDVHTPKETYGVDFDDKTGELYDALQAAGLIPKLAETESKK